MSTYRYKSDAICREIVIKSAGIAILAGLAVNLPIAVSLIGVSTIAGCYERSDYIQSLAILPAIHLLIFIIVFALMCAMYVWIVTGTEEIHEKK